VSWDLTDVVPLPGFRLAVRFVDGTAGFVDLSARVASTKSGVFAALRNPAVFSEVFIAYGAVAWPGDIDLAPDAMHAEIRAHGEWVLR